MNIFQRWLATLLPEEAFYVCRREHGGYITNNGHAAFYAEIYPRLKVTAQQHGWELALHGSLNHDMDIMAMPFEASPSRPADLIDALRRSLGLPEKCMYILRSKYNGRIMYGIRVAPDFLIDINIINHALGPNVPDEEI